jgi:hypothetical protein
MKRTWSFIVLAAALLVSAGPRSFDNRVQAAPSHAKVKSLHALPTGVDALGAKMGAAVTSLKNGPFNLGKVAAVVAAVAATGVLAAKRGYSIKDLPMSVPGNG